MGFVQNIVTKPAKVAGVRAPAAAGRQSVKVGGVGIRANSSLLAGTHSGRPATVSKNYHPKQPAPITMKAQHPSLHPLKSQKQRFRAAKRKATK